MVQRNMAIVWLVQLSFSLADLIFLAFFLDLLRETIIFLLNNCQTLPFPL
ncbi:hypothetical protein N665_0076s0324 [Sinapis alba]|nr:hypothetical protein N665_0076s0324 [Sinapis alba]